jgi:hypothetical protein
MFIDAEGDKEIGTVLRAFRIHSHLLCLAECADRPMILSVDDLGKTYLS